jgi:hypothetical protein
MAQSATDPITEARAQRTVQNLREHWERGTKANREVARSTPRELAEKYGVNPHTLRKDRRFAGRYTEKELEELLSLRRPDGMPLHWGHVIYLITLNRKLDRQRLQKQAAREGWTAPDLYVAIRRKFHKESDRGGRPVKVPHSAQAKLRLLFHETDRWLARYRAIFGEDENGLLSELEAIPDGATGELKRSLEEKLNEMASLSRGLNRKMGRRSGTRTRG